MIDRYLRWYEKMGNKFIDEEKIGNISIEVLRNIFRPTEKDVYMYDCYPVNNAAWEYLRKYVSVNFDDCKYDYFLESEQGNE